MPKIDPRPDPLPPMTFLEFICRKLIGPPTSSKCNGESYWPCPHCGSEKFHTMPHKPPHKDRFTCWVCPFRGDAADLMRYFYPHERYPQHLDRLADLQHEYDCEMGRAAESLQSAPAGGPGQAATSSSGEPGMMSRAFDHRRVSDTWAELTRDERDVLIAARRIMDEKTDDISFFALTDFCLGFQEWAEQSEQRHYAECQDPDCSARVCQAVRGLPPLTPGGIEADRQAEKARREAEAVEVERLVKEMATKGQQRRQEMARNRINGQPSLNGTGGHHAADRRR